MKGNSDVTALVIFLPESNSYQKCLLTVMPQECIMTVWIEPRIVKIDIHQVKKSAFRYGVLGIDHTQHTAVHIAQLHLRLCQARSGRLTSGEPAAQRRHTPIVKYGCTSVISAESLGIGSGLAKFLPGIYHHRPGA